MPPLHVPNEAALHQPIDTSEETTIQWLTMSSGHGPPSPFALPPTTISSDHLLSYTTQSMKSNGKRLRLRSASQ